MRKRFPAADAVVFGHGHLPLHEEEHGARRRRSMVLAIDGTAYLLRPPTFFRARLALALDLPGLAETFLGLREPLWELGMSSMTTAPLKALI